MCSHSWATVTPVKYEHDILKAISFFISKNKMEYKETEKIVRFQFNVFCCNFGAWKMGKSAEKSQEYSYMFAYNSFSQEYYCILVVLCQIITKH